MRRLERPGFGTSVALVASCGVLAWACRASPGETTPAVRPPVAPSSELAARWVFHPRAPEPISARTAIDSAELVVDRGGSRWLVRAGGSPEPAPYGAPEALVAARVEGDGFAFVGDSGTVYGARAALGPFVSVRRPPEVSFAAAAHEDIVLAVGQDGQLRRSTDLGRSWRAVPIDGFVVDVALDREGRALALSAPEQWFWSVDRGKTFRAIAPGTIAPRELLGGGAHVHVEGWLGAYEFDGTAFQPSAAPGVAKTTWALPRGPSALGVVAGHAALETDFVGLVGHGAGLSLARATLGGAMRERAVQGLQDCSRSRLARHMDRLLVVCAEKAEAGTSTPLILWRGDATSARFEREPVALRGDFERVRLALAADGTALLSGICAAKEQDPGCMPRGVYRLAPGGRALAALPAAFEEVPSDLAFATTGEPWATFVRGKDGAAVLVIWGPQASQSGQGDAGHSIDLSAELELSARALDVEILGSKTSPMGVLVRHVEGAATVGLDRAGRLITSGRVPPEVAAVHGAGLRVAAVSLERGVFFESEDGGVTWAESHLPRSPCPAQRSDCTPSLVCSDAGCLLGDELTRVGWGSQEVASPAALAARASREQERASPVEYSCRMAGEGPLLLPHLLEVPGAAEAALGDADFTAVEYDAQSGAVDFTWVPRGQRRLERVRGLAAVKEPDRYALSIVPQVEGTAALRYRVPVRQTGDRMLSEIEVAWNNRLLGVTGRHRLPSVIEGRQGDYQAPGSGPGEALPQLLSVAGPGLYLALHRAGSGAQATYYFEGGSALELRAPKLPALLGDASDAEYVRIGDEHLPLVFAANRTRVFLGGGTNAGASEPGVALLLGDAPAAVDRAQGIRLAYRGDRIGVVSMMADVDGRYWAARFAELGTGAGRVLGDVVRVPLKPDLAPVPQACSDAIRQTTPRIVAPPFPGRTALLRVTQGQTEIGRFVLRGAVLHGTPDDACLSAWSGEPEQQGPRGSAAGVLLLPSERGLLGWLFSEKDQERSTGGFEAWPLSCELAR